MINRELQPKFKTSAKLNVVNISENKLSNGVPYYVLNEGSQDVVKIDFLFNAGTIYNNNPLVADTVNALIEAGTPNRTSVEIAEELDFYGAFLEVNIGKHLSQIILYTLNKYFNETLNIIADIIFNANFPEHEVDIYIKNKFQGYLISRQKTDVLSQELFSETIFGISHPYGRSISENDFKQINSNILTQFYNENYSIGKLKIVISGKVENDHIQFLDDKFGQQKITEIKNNQINFDSEVIKEKKKFLDVKGALQSSIRIGKETINRTHHDFFNLNITSIILGGYFGSRLMTNIREDKGYTYGIYAGNMSLLNAGFFYISAESGKDVYEKAIDEIYKELKILRTGFVSVQELNRVKNYLIGNFSRTFDGAFSKSDVFKSVLMYNFNLDYYNRFFNAINAVTPDVIKETAEKYLKEDSMIEIIAGTK